MEISFDPAKRAATIAARGLDFAAAVEVFDGPTVTIEDTRENYGEIRWITMGLLDDRAVVVAWQGVEKHPGRAGQGRPVADRAPQVLDPRSRVRTRAGLGALKKCRTALFQQRAGPNVAAAGASFQ